MENNNEKINEIVKSSKTKSEKSKTVIGICLLAVFITLFVIGFTNGEATTVFIKAANICLECIGIG